MPFVISLRGGEPPHRPSAPPPLHPSADVYFRTVKPENNISLTIKQQLLDTAHFLMGEWKLLTTLLMCLSCSPRQVTLEPLQSGSRPLIKALSSQETGSIGSNMSAAAITHWILKPVVHFFLRSGPPLEMSQESNDTAGTLK